SKVHGRRLPNRTFRLSTFERTVAPVDAVLRASQSTVYSLFAAQARVAPRAPAVVDGARTLSYAALARRVRRLAPGPSVRGVGRGDRVAVLSENRLEILELLLAAARAGAIVACQSFRLTQAELGHCLALVTPALVLTSPRFPLPGALLFGDDYERALAS